MIKKHRTSQEKAIQRTNELYRQQDTERFVMSVATLLRQLVTDLQDPKNYPARTTLYSHFMQAVSALGADLVTPEQVPEVINDAIFYAYSNDVQQRIVLEVLAEAGHIPFQPERRLRDAALSVGAAAIKPFLRSK